MMQMSKKKSPIKINFPEAVGNFWCVLWINQIYYHSKERKIDVFFFNCKEINDKYDQSIIYRTKLVIGNLSEFGLGSVYNVKERKFEDINFGDIYQIKISQPLHLAKTIEFPINGNVEFIPRAHEIVPIGFSYLKTFGENKSINRSILISPYTILQYFLFYNDELISKALSGKLAESFKLKEIKYRVCEDTGELIGMLQYDANNLSEKAAIIMAPYIFFKDHSGIKFIKSIHSHVESCFLNTLSGNLKSYLSFNWHEFKDYIIEVCGKFYDVNKKKYLLAHRICNFQFNDPQPFIVDRIELFPFNEKNSTDDRKNHNPEDVNRLANPKLDGVSLNLNADNANPLPPLNILEDRFSNPLNIQVDIINRDIQLSAYNTNYKPNSKIIDSLTREIENLDNESKNIIENIKNIIIKASNFEYFRILTTVLKKEFLSNDSKFKISRYNNENKYYIAEVLYENKAMYFVEFGNGIIGIFNSIDKYPIEEEALYALIDEFLEYKDNVGVRKVLWTLLKNKYAEYYNSKKKIILHTGVKHLDVPKGYNPANRKEALIVGARRTAENIYKFRIIPELT